ncbi:hypothetical protein ACT3CE_17750 [Marinifilum sp. RC60d5]|uniref:hypothetical protein n=1 Tax=Marinifilum sp. RC60d5 TaxID=3458414 RepID=UPI0040357B20
MKALRITLFLLLYLNFLGITSNSFFIAKIVVFIPLGCFFYSFTKKIGLFHRNYIFLFIGLLLSVLSSYFFRNQAFLHSVNASYFLLLLFFYFYLKIENPRIKTIEGIIIFLAITVSLFYILQNLLLPYGIVFLKSADKDMDLTENGRFRIIGSTIFGLGYFLSFNKIITKSNNKYIYLATVLLCLISVLIMRFRTLTVALFISTFFLMYKTYGLSRRILYWSAIVLLSLFILSQVPIVEEQLNYILEKQLDKSNSFENADYARLVSLDYYVNHHFKSQLEMFTGSGIPYYKSEYGVLMQDLIDQHLYYGDWGLFGYSVAVGWITVIAIFSILIKILFLKVDKNKYYLSAFVFYLLLSSITTAEIFREGNFLILSLSLFIAEVANRQYIVYNNKIVYAQKKYCNSCYNV